MTENDFEKNIEKRIDNIETLLRLMLVNNIINNGDINKIADENEYCEDEKCITENNFKIINRSYRDNINILYVQKNKCVLADALKLLHKVKNTIIVFVFEKMTSSQKSAFISKGVSFYCKKDVLLNISNSIYPNKNKMKSGEKENE